LDHLLSKDVSTLWAATPVEESCAYLSYWSAARANDQLGKVFAGCKEIRPRLPKGERGFFVDTESNCDWKLPSMP
jgi:hypothetical protein